MIATQQELHSQLQGRWEEQDRIVWRAMNKRLKDLTDYVYALEQRLTECEKDLNGYFDTDTP